MHGLNPHNVDCWNVELHSVDEIVAYIRSMSLYCTERDGHYINFTPTPLETYFASENVAGEYWDGTKYQRIEWQPKLDDLQYLRSFKFVDLTFRGTLELRSTCTQPFSEAMTVPALNVGLAEHLNELEKILDNSGIFRYGYTTAELRKMFVKTPLPAFAQSDKLKVTLHQIVWLAYNGLRDRGLGEEELLLPLLDRADRMESPAAEMIRNLKNGKTLEDYILRYGSFGVNAEEESCCTLMMNI
jgi:gamma-glutamylcysteine synthetase